MPKPKQTKEEVVANKMLELVKDVTLNLDEVGESVADNSPAILYNRLEVVMETARDRKESGYIRDWA